MNADITRPVIVDLLPVYLAGEASAESRALIDEYARQDPHVARLIKAASATWEPQPAAPAKDREEAAGPGLEMDALRRTKRHLRARTTSLMLAILFSLLAVSFQFGPGGVRWTWQESPLLAVAFGVTGGLSWCFYFAYRRRLSNIGV